MAAAAEEKKAKQLLEQIRRLSHNKTCVNCAKESLAGFGDVNIKHSTFVCHLCKSAHQSFSHRCKSVSLSNWTLAEVQKLSDQAGGGNAHARQTWLGKLEGKLVLRPDDPLDKVKAFVDEAYNYRKYWKEPSSGSHGTNSPVAATESPVASRKDMAVPSTQQPPSPPHRPPVAAPATADFLDFAADFTHAPSPNNSSSIAVAPTAATSGFDFINQQQLGHGSTTAHNNNNDWESFGAFVTATPSRSATPSSPPPLPPPQQRQPSPASAFGFISQPPPQPPTHPAQPFATSPNQDGFGSFMASSPAPPAPVPPMAMPMAPPPARPVQPPMVLTRPLVEDPFAVLQQPAYGGGGGGGYMAQAPQQAPRPPMHMMMGPPGGGGFGGPHGGGMARPPMGMPMHMQQQYVQQQQQQAPHMMGGPPRGFSNGMAGVGTPLQSSHHQPYKPQEPDPFASLDWRK